MVTSPSYLSHFCGTRMRSAGRVMCAARRKWRTLTYSRESRGRSWTRPRPRFPDLRKQINGAVTTLDVTLWSCIRRASPVPNASRRTDSIPGIIVQVTSCVGFWLFRDRTDLQISYPVIVESGRSDNVSKRLAGSTGYRQAEAILIAFQNSSKKSKNPKKLIWKKKRRNETSVTSLIVKFTFFDFRIAYAKLYWFFKIFYSNLKYISRIRGGMKARKLYRYANKINLRIFRYLFAKVKQRLVYLTLIRILIRLSRISNKNLFVK